MTDSPPPPPSGVPFRLPSGKPIAGPRTVHAAVAIASALFSRNGAPPPSERLAYLEIEVEDFLARAGSQARWMLSCMIWLVSLAAPLFVGRLGALSALAPGERIRALERLERHFGEPLIAVKAILCLLYYEHPDSAREAGFDGKCLLPGAPR
jgi:hypothetical protein